MRVAVFSTKPYDRQFLEVGNASADFPHELVFLEPRLSVKTAPLAVGNGAICAFVNDCLDRSVLERLAALGIKLIVLRSAGFNNIDLPVAGALKLAVARVPAYSSQAIAEHTLALILSLDRKIHKAYARVREGNFSLDGLFGFDLGVRTVGIIGTGKIGAAVARILHGFDAGLSALAAPVGMLETGMDTFAGKIPTILKLNSANSLSAIKDQAVVATVDDAVRLNCAAVGFTLYPGSEAFLGQAEELRIVSQEARTAGFPLLVWSYHRGGSITDRGKTALDIIAYAAHIAVELGAHIVKVKLPGKYIEQEAARPAYADRQWTDPVARIKHVVQAAFAGRRLVLFSGGAVRDAESLYKDARAIRDGDGNGPIIGRNSFQRPRAEALAMLDEIVQIYSGSG